MTSIFHHPNSFKVRERKGKKTDFSRTSQLLLEF